VLKGALNSNEKAVELKKVLTKDNRDPLPLSPVEGLALMVLSDLSQRAYKNIRTTAKDHNANIYPSQENILQARNDCYPDLISIEDWKAEIPVQELLNHTCFRLLHLDSIKEELAKLKLKNDSKIHCILNCKWGFDGSSGQSQYKQRFSSTEENFSDSNLFSTTLVPLDLSFGDVSLWRNQTTSSTRFCRPIRIQYIKETEQVLKNEQAYIQNQIDRLEELLVEIPLENGSKVELSISFSMKLTMIDGKAANAICGIKSAQICNICKCSPKEMNRRTENKIHQINPNSIELGLSPLHLWIRFFENIIHISYRIDIKSWQIRAENKQACLEKKLDIQKKFRSQLGILVDFPKDSGSGTSNDRNTARRASKEYKVFARITGVDENLIKRYYVILSVVNSNHKINITKFEEYCSQTFKLYVEKYDWFYMPASVHKVLIHSAKIISNFSLPIGMYSEDAQEARNKDNKNYRLHHARKIDRKKTMEDQFHYLLKTSDPIISTIILDGYTDVLYQINDENDYENDQSSQIEDEMSNDESAKQIEDSNLDLPNDFYY